MPEMRESMMSCLRQPSGQARVIARDECLRPRDSDHRLRRSMIERGRVRDGLTPSFRPGDPRKRAPLMQRCE